LIGSCRDAGRTALSFFNSFVIHLLVDFYFANSPSKKCICTSGALEELTGKNMKMEQTGNSLEKLKSSLEYENSQLKVRYFFNDY